MKREGLYLILRPIDAIDMITLRHNNNNTIEILPSFFGKKLRRSRRPIDSFGVKLCSIATAFLSVVRLFFFSVFDSALIHSGVDSRFDIFHP